MQVTSNQEGLARILSMIVGLPMTGRHVKDLNIEKELEIMEGLETINTAFIPFTPSNTK